VLAFDRDCVISANVASCPNAARGAYEARTASPNSRVTAAAYKVPTPNRTFRMAERLNEVCCSTDHSAASASARFKPALRGLGPSRPRVLYGQPGAGPLAPWPPAPFLPAFGFLFFF